jgi:hypothetical protein
MSGIFRLNKDNTVVITPEAKELCVILSTLDPKTFLYIVLAYDTLDSPYRLMSVEDRKRIARHRIWGTSAAFPEDNPMVVDAIEEMKSICFDYNQDTKEVLLGKLQLLNNELITSSTVSIKPLMDAIKLIEDKIEELDQKMDRDFEIMYLKGSKKLSLIEMFMRNRQKYTEKMKTYGFFNRQD